MSNLLNQKRSKSLLVFLISSYFLVLKITTFANYNSIEKSNVLSKSADYSAGSNAELVLDNTDIELDNSRRVTENSNSTILIDNNVPVPVVDLTVEGNKIDLLEQKLSENLSQLNEKDKTHKKIVEFIPEIDLTKNLDKSGTSANIKDLTSSSYNAQHQLITALQDRVIFLEAELYKLQHRVDILYQDSRERHIDLDERVIILRSEIQKMQAKNVLDTKSLDFNTPESNNAEITDKIKQVKVLMKGGKYQQSKDILLEIEKKLPLTVETVKVHPEIFEVYYWRTEVDILLNNLKGALAISKQMVICFDNHERMPELLYKLGYLFEATGDGKESHRVLKSIITDYPHSSSASLAKKILRKERIHIK